MRSLWRLVVGVVALLVAAVLALALLLPRLLATETVRERIQAAAEDAVGSEVRYGALEVGLLPPSLLVMDVTVAGATAASPRLVEAERVALRLALLPLLARTVVVESLSVRRPVVRLLRTAAGIELPRREAAASPEPAPERAAGEGASVGIALAGFALHEGTVVLEDRSVSPAQTWELRDVELHARAESLDRPVGFDLVAELGGGGRVSASGSVSLAGSVQAEAELQAVELSPVRPYVGGDLAGAFSGTVAVSGPVANPALLQLDGVVEGGRMRLDDAVLAGRLSVSAEVRQLRAAPSGRFDIDATAAQIRYGDVVAKQPGAAATVSGKIVSASDGTIGLDDVVLRIRDFHATGRVRLGKRVRIVAEAPPFDLAGLHDVVPSLARYRLSGPARLENLAVTTSPLDVRGAVHLDGVTAVLPERGPVRLEGSIVGRGDHIDTEDLQVVAADQVIDVAASARELGGALRYRLDLTTRGADANRLLSTFSSKRDFLYGLLTLDGRVQGAALGDRPPLEDAAGRIHIDIDRGRLKGVSLLQLTFDHLGSLGSVATLASRLLGGPDLSRFYGDDFQEISGSFDIADGFVRTDDLRIVYRSYTVDLRGALHLSDLGIDMTGRITIGDEIGRALGRTDPTAAGENTIPLARVTGTLDRPQVRVTPEVAAAFLGRMGAGSKLQRTLDDAVGGEVGDLLEGILGGGSRPRSR